MEEKEKEELQAKLLKEQIELIEEEKEFRNFTFIGNNLYTFSFLKTIIRY